MGNCCGNTKKTMPAYKRQLTPFNKKVSHNYDNSVGKIKEKEEILQQK